MQNTPVIKLIDEAENIAIKGSLCQKEGQLEEAVFYYKQALNENPNLQQVHYNLGIVLYQQGDLLEAYQSYKKAIALQPDDVNGYYNMGLVLQDQGLFAEAIDSYQQVINLSKIENSNHHDSVVNSYNNWGCILLQENQTDAALSVFKKALLLKPDDFTIYNNIGQALLQKSQLDQGISYLEKSLKLEPLFTTAIHHLGKAYQTQGLHQEAVEYFQQIIKLEPENLTAYSESFYSLMEQGKFSEAMTNLQKVIQNNSFVEGYCKWGSLLAESTDELDKSKVSCAKFLTALKKSNFLNSSSVREISQYLVETYLHLGNVSAESGAPDQGEFYYKKALDIQPLATEDYLKLGNSLVKKNLINSAIIIYHLGLVIAPNNPQILEKLQSLSKSQKSQKKPKFLSSSYQGLNSQPWSPQKNEEFNLLHLGNGIYSCSENFKTAKISGKKNSLYSSETETFVAQLPCGRAWVVPQKKSGMISSAIAIINQENQLVKELSHSEPGQLSGWQNCDGNKHEIGDLEELPKLEKIDGKVAVLSGLYDHVYFNWMVDILPKLEILKNHGMNLEEIDGFLVNSFHLEFQRESWKILGIPQKKIILSDRHPYIQAQQLIVPSCRADVGMVTSWGLEFHRRVFFPRIKQERLTENQSRSFYPERIYISRNNSRYRRVFNEEEVLLKLNQLGFVCLQPESMTLTEKIAIFAHAKVIIAAHGSILTNIIFSAPGTQVIELVSPKYIRNYYSVISQQVGLEHYYLKGEDFGCAPIRQLMYQNPVTEDIIVNLNSLKKLLKVIGISENKKIRETVVSSENKVSIQKDKVSIQKDQQLGIKNLSQEQKNLPMEQVGKKTSLKVNSQEIAAKLNERAELYLKEKELELAKATCEEALKHKPDYGVACKTLGNVFYAQEQLETACYWYTKAIEYQPNLAEAYANLGTLSVRKEQWQEAISYYQKAIKIQPEFPGVYRNLARLYKKIGNYAQAVKFSRKADYLEPVNQKRNQKNQVIKSTLYYKNLGKILQSRGEVEAAWQSYKKGVELQPNDPEIYLNIGGLYAQQQQWKEAIKCYQKSLALNPNYTDAYRKLARAWTEIGQTTKADKCWYRAYSLEPEKATAEEHLMLGNSLLQEKVIAQAISCYCRAMELNPNLLGAYESLGEALKLQGINKTTTQVFPNHWQNAGNSRNLLTAENPQNSQEKNQQFRGENTIDIIQKPKDCERVVSRQVNRVTSTFNLKNDLSDSDDYLESSLSLLENDQAKGVANSREITPTVTPNKPLIIEPNVTNIYGNLEGETTLINTPAKTNNNQIIHSIPQINHRTPINLKSVLKSMTYTNGQGNIPNIYIQEAQKYYDQGLYEKAISECQQAISLEIDAVVAYIILGKSMEKVGQIKQAESNYQTALKIQPNNASIYRLLGNLYVEYQSGSLAIYCYQKAVEIEPKVADNYRQLALVWAELGEAKAAIDCWSQADSLESKEVTANDHFNLGNKLYEKGRITQAVFCYQNSIELNPNLGSVYYNLSVALRCLGRLDEAVTYHHKAREIWADKNQNQDNLKADINSSISANLEVKYQNGHQLNAAEIKREIWVEKNQNQNNLKVDTNSYISPQNQNGHQPTAGEIKREIWVEKNQNQNNLKVDTNSHISAQQQNGHQPSPVEIKGESSQPRQLNQIVLNHRNYSQKAQIKEILKQANTYYLEGLFSEAIATCERAIKVQENPEAYQIMGKANHKKNQVDNAINCYHQALKLNPKDSGTNYEMGNILALLPGKLEEAITYYHKALEIEPYLTEAYYSLANILVNQDQLEKVVILYEKLIEIQPNLWEPHHNLGDILIKQEKFSEAISAYGHAIKLNPNSSVSYFKLAEILAKVGELSQAINAYHKVIAIDPDFVDAYQCLGDTLRNKGEKEEAIKVYRKAVEIQPQLWEVHHKLGSLFQETEELEAAANAYRKSIELNPDFCWSYNNLGDVLVRLEKWSEATGVYSRAIELNPDFGWSYNNLGDVLVKLEKWSEAKSVYHQAIELNPDFPWNYYKLGDVLVKLEDWEGAIKIYDEAVTMDSQVPPWYLYKLGSLLRQQGKFQDAVGYLRQAVKMKTDVPKFYLDLGATLVKLGQWSEAQDHLEWVIQFPSNSLPTSENLHKKLDATSLLNTDLAEAYYYLGAVKSAQQQWSEAVEYYRQSLKINSNRGECCLSLAEALGKLGQWSEAVEYYRQAVFLSGGSSEVMFLLGDALGHLQQWLKDPQGEISTHHKAITKYLKITLFTPYYQAKDLERQNEFIYCLKKNIQCPEIEKIVLMVDDHHQPELEHPKIEIVKITSRATYLDWVELTEKKCRGRISILANTDIYFDESVARIREIFSIDPQGFVALSRYETEGDKQILHENPHWSQDVWAVLGEYNFTEYFKNDLRIPLGVPGCDNKIAYLFAVHGAQVYNPCHHIKTLHFQKSQLQSYGQSGGNTLGATAWVYPNVAIDEPSKLQIELWNLNLSHLVGVTINEKGKSEKATVFRAPDVSVDDQKTIEQNLQLPQKEGLEKVELVEVESVREVNEKVEESNLTSEQAGSNGWFEQAKRLHQEERFEEAVAAYKGAIAQNPNFTEAHYKLGQTLSQLRRWEEAVVEYRKTISLGFDEAELRHHLGYGLIQLGCWEEAGVELRNTLELSPGSPVVWLQLGDVLRELGKRDEAVEAYMKALETEPKSADVLENLGNSLHQLGFLDEAIAAFRSVVWIKPNVFRIHDKLAALFYEKGQQNKAEIRTQKRQALKYHSPTIEELTRQQKQLYETVGVEKTDPQTKSGYPWELPHKLADVLRDRGELDEAAEAYRYAIDVNPSNVHSYQNLGDVLQQQGEKEQAAIIYAQGIELDPSHFQGSKDRQEGIKIPIGGKWNTGKKILRVAVIGNYLPRKCGIATFTTDLCNALSKVDEDVNVLAVAINDSDRSYGYPSRVALEIEQNSVTSYRRAADFLNQNDIDVVCLQHEYGIFGGSTGTHIFTLLERLRMPIFATLHTVLQTPNEEEGLVIEELSRLCQKLVVMSERGVAFLEEVFGIPKNKIEMIYHGVHDVPFTDSSTYKNKFSLGGKNVILTFGLLGRNKGIEYVIQAMRTVVEEFPNTVYLCVGATHPHLVKHEGEIYRESLVRLANDFRVANNVIFINKFLELDELIEYIGATDIYITPYLTKTQITSGTLAYTFSAGKAVISTPYWHAEELLAEGRGILVPFKDSEAIASEILNLLNNPEELNNMRKRAYLYGRQMTWLAVARRYMEMFVQEQTILR